eukprot:CAMPEP_0170115432 /NCGR_PEP_ID=MMETSP0020_2-20130122/11488_1 /TAXON_ID=98059 /ORGANISM="Dinobryon sp., Strain UTEXLB2267" /LENGTH=681 /DNA_ID=CAMNT_0010342993 /DNA_START=54 /DNA_END=2099 /DNA_ORIENTATION=-
MAPAFIDDCTQLELKKAESLKVESDMLIKSVVNNPLPSLTSESFEAMINELKSAIGHSDVNFAPTSGSDELTPEKNWLLCDRTENGAVTFESSGSCRLDFFYKVTEGSSVSLVRDLLDTAWAENSLDTLQLIAQLRDVRNGKCDKLSSYIAAEWLLEKHPLTFIENLPNLVEVGYWKDILNFLQTRCLGEPWKEPYKGSSNSNKVEAAIARREKRIKYFINAKKVFQDDKVYRLLHLSVAALFSKELKKDLHSLRNPTNESFSSLAAKWAPSPMLNHDKTTLIASTIAELMFPSSESNDGNEVETYKDYIDRVRMKYQTEVLAPLRRASFVPEVFMSAKKWNEVDYNRVASKCMKKNCKSFEKHDIQRFTAYLSKVSKGKAKIAAGALKPYEMLQTAMDSSSSSIMSFMNELQWDSYVETLRSKGSLTNCLAVCDVSGSMFSGYSGVEPITVAVSLSLLVAELASPPYNNIFCTFSLRPVMHEIKGDTLKERYDSIANKDDWMMNTDFNAVFDLILSRAVAVNLPPEGMIQTIFVFSDMEFDAAESRIEGQKTNFQIAKQKFEKYGYKLPRIVFWNLRGDSRSHNRGASVPVRGDESNVALISGFSGQMLANFMDGKIEEPEVAVAAAVEEPEVAVAAAEVEPEVVVVAAEEKTKEVVMTPFEKMMSIIKSGKYDDWKVVD